MLKKASSHGGGGPSWLWVILIFAIGGASFMGAMLGTMYGLDGRTAGGQPCLTGTESQPADRGGGLVTAGHIIGTADSPAEDLHDAAVNSGSAATTAGPSGVGSKPKTSEGGAIGAAPSRGGSGSASAAPSGRGFNVDARMRVQWQEITAMCNNRNYTSCAAVDRYML